MNLPARRELLLIAIAGLAGCAPLPPQPPRPELAQPQFERTVGAASADAAFSRGDLPQRDWWRRFGEKNLDALEDAALQGNPDLAAARARIARAREAAHLAEQEAGIRYSSDATAVRQHLSENGLFPPPMGGSTFNEGDASVAAAYTLDWWGKNRALVQAAAGEARAAEAERAAAELVLSAQVADAYFAWQDVVARLALARRSAQTRAALHRLAGLRVKRGIDSALAVRQLEVQLAQDKDSERDLRAQSAILRDRLALLAGKGPDWGAALAEPDLVPGGSFPLPAALPLDILAWRPDVAALKWRAEVAASRIDSAKADFYPNVDLRLAVGLQSLDLGTWLAAKSWYASVGPAVHIPLFNVGSLSDKLGIREAEYAEAVAQYNQGLIVAAGQVADAMARLGALAAREDLQRVAGASAARSLKLVATRYESGLADRLPLLTEEIAFLAQRAREARTRAERKRAMASLFLALGGGDEEGEKDGKSRLTAEDAK